MDLPVGKIKTSSFHKTESGFSLVNDLYNNTLIYAKSGYTFGEYCILVEIDGRKEIYTITSDHNFESSNRGYLRDTLIERLGREGYTFHDIGLCYQDLDDKIRVGTWVVTDNDFYRATSQGVQS